MKKILIIPSWYPNETSRSSGIFFLKQAELLSKTYDVKILIAKENLIGYRKLLKDVRQLFNINLKISNHFLDILPLVPVKQFEYSNFAFLSDTRKNQKVTKAYLKYFRTAFQSSWIPDIIHAHDVFNAGIISKELKKVFNIPYVITSHNPINFDKWTPTKTQLFKQVLASADKIITVSNYDKRLLINFFDDEIDPVNLGNYIDEKQFFITDVNKNREGVNLLYIGTTSKRKDFLTLLKAVNILKKKNIGFKLMLIVTAINDGVTLQDIQSQIINTELNDFVTIQTEVYFNNMLEIFSNADIYVSSSYFETFGVAVAEAMCCGIPVVAADNGGVRDMIENNINGIIVQIKDPEAIADEVLKLISGEKKFDPHQIRASIVEKFGSMAYLNNLSSVYDTIIND